MPKVSIIMPSLNVKAYIQECMNSVLSQTLEDIEIICVDADSTDGTREVLQEYAKKDSRVILLRDDKKSSGYANNRAIDQATGEYIGIVETDDYIVPEMFEKLYEYAEMTQAEIVKADFDSFSDCRGKRIFVRHNILGGRKEYYKVLNPRCNKFIFDAEMFNWAGIYRRDFLNRYHIRHQETPGASFQDNGFWFQVFAFATRVYFVHESFYRYRKDNPNSSIHNQKKVFCMCDEYDFAQKKLEMFPEVWRAVYYFCLGKRYKVCAWTLRKVLPEFRQILCDRMYDDFSKRLRTLNEISNIWSRKDRYYKELYLLMTDKKQYLNDIFRKQESYSLNIESFIQKVKGKNIVIFGGGQWGTGVQDLLWKNGIDILAFCDNDSAKHGQCLNGVSIYSLMDVLKKVQLPYFIVASERYSHEIVQQLSLSHVDQSSIFIYQQEKYIWE